MRRYFCDICGKELTIKDINIVNCVTDVNGHIMHMQSELCDDCYKEYQSQD